MSGNTGQAAIELWGGAECTVNRVQDSYYDQTVRTGHDARQSDLDLFAALGIRALRYPVLWERTAPNGIENADWSWPDARLGRLRDLGMRPIITLLHHGSGPQHTGLLDPAFPEAFAAYAGAVARRYPWVLDWTPINEPLTTARFSALYGHWYPHARDPLLFARALINECRAISLAMRAIREVNPAARLVQTEDLGKMHSTPLLRYQADFENERRWLTFDLLCGRLDRHHPLWDFLTELSIEEKSLMFFSDTPCPPDILGLNYYLTSERYIDENIENFSAWTQGGNSRHVYADVEAVRVLPGGMDGPLCLLREAWDRYKLPIAVTEAHNACTREEQMRWFVEVWNAAHALCDEGADVRAVTAWALLGAYDWDSLVTQVNEHYESGVFDIRAPTPRPTALVHLLCESAANKTATHPVLASPGWWRRPERLLYSCSNEPIESKLNDYAPAPPLVRPILITGATGTLGSAFARICERRGLAFRLLTRQEMDIADIASVRAAVDCYRPWAIVNAAGYVRVDEAEMRSERCLRENTLGPATVAAVCSEEGVHLLTFSSDLVFDGLKRAMYTESDRTSPLNVYGRSKALAEMAVLDSMPDALLVRTSAFFGPWDRYNFVTAALHTITEGKPFPAANDTVVSPTYLPDLVNVSLNLLIDDARGVWHLANAGETSWYDLARRAAQLGDLDANRVEGVESSRLGWIARRPLYSAMTSERAWLMPSLDDALHRYMQERQIFVATKIAL